MEYDLVRPSSFSGLRPIRLFLFGLLLLDPLSQCVHLPLLLSFIQSVLGLDVQGFQLSGGEDGGDCSFEEYQFLHDECHVQLFVHLVYALVVHARLLPLRQTAPQHLQRLVYPQRHQVQKVEPSRRYLLLLLSHEQLTGHADVVGPFCEKVHKEGKGEYDADQSAHVGEVVVEFVETAGIGAGHWGLLEDYLHELAVGHGDGVSVEVVGYGREEVFFDAFDGDQTDVCLHVDLLNVSSRLEAAGCAEGEEVAVLECLAEIVLILSVDDRVDQGHQQSELPLHSFQGLQVSQRHTVGTDGALLQSDGQLARHSRDGLASE